MYVRVSVRSVQDSQSMPRYCTCWLVDCLIHWLIVQHNLGLHLHHREPPYRSPYPRRSIYTPSLIYRLIAAFLSIVAFAPLCDPLISHSLWSLCGLNVSINLSSSIALSSHRFAIVSTGVSSNQGAGAWLVAPASNPPKPSLTASSYLKQASKQASLQASPFTKSKPKSKLSAQNKRLILFRGAYLSIHWSKRGPEQRRQQRWRWRLIPLGCQMPQKERSLWGRPNHSLYRWTNERVNHFNEWIH